MSKRITVISISSLFLMIAVHSIIIGQQPSRTTGIKPSSANTARTAEVIAATNQILEEVSKLRGLNVLNPVKSGVKSRNEIEQEVVRNFQESYKPEELETIKKLLTAYGLVPKDFKYREFMTKLLTEQVAGFYRTKSKELFIADWNELNQQKPVMAHELTHALQDQHFDLKRFEDWPRGDSDREAAIHALIEGDATGVMFSYQLKPMNTDITRLPNITNFADQSLLQAEKDGQKIFLSAPASIRESLIFPYVYGAGFVQELVRQRGWEGVSLAFNNLPQSTEQIIHFNKYAAREEPIKIQLPDVTSILGADWKRIDADVNGEFGYFLILSEFIDKKEARTAAEGWGGDHSTLYENAKTKQLLLIHLSVWDSAKDAEEFFQAYKKRTVKRYSQHIEQKERPSNEHHFQTTDGGTSIKWSDKAVLVIEGWQGEQSVNLEQLVDACWKSKTPSQ